MKMKTCGFLLAIALSVAFTPGMRAAERPLIGAQVWIQPGQTPEEIDGWFRQLAESYMPVARVWIVWDYVQTGPGRWDFSLYDATFRSAEKYKVKVVATLTAWDAPSYLTEFNAGTEADKDRLSADYIARVVQRYKGSAALDTWLLQNEPGDEIAASPASVAAFKEWIPRHYATIASLNQRWRTAYRSFADFDGKTSKDWWNPTSRIDWMTFSRDYLAGRLAWLAQQVRTYDTAHGTHLNPAGVAGNLAGESDDLPKWRPFLDSLGCSIHPAWHFGLMTRDRYALGVAYVNDLVRGSIEPKPHWVTELQGGNNIYSGVYPMDPTADEIAQWVWTSIGSGADRVIFWLLNARKQGTEAAEWSLLDFQQRPSARMKTATAIAEKVDSDSGFFDNAKPLESSVTLILSLETMTLEAEYARRPDEPGRGAHAEVIETLGLYEALTQIGVSPRVKHIHDYDWRARSEHPRTAILPDIRAITSEQVADFEAFVANGNTLIVTGLTGFYDPYVEAWPLNGFPLARVVGGELKEVHYLGDKLTLQLNSPPIALPSHLWISEIDNHSAEPISQKDGVVMATSRRVGTGRVIWIPSPVGMGAWLTDSRPLASYLQEILSPGIASQPFRFPRPQPNCLMRVLQDGNAYVTVLVNGSETESVCTVQPPVAVHPSTIWGEPPVPSAQGDTVFRLGSRATSVVKWQ